MKGITFMLFLLGVINTVTSQEIEIKLENFYEIHVSRGLKVMLHQADENRAVITGNSRDEVDLKVERGRLLVKSSLNKLLKIDDTQVDLYFKELQYIDVSQNSYVEFKTEIEQSTIKLRSREGAELNLKVNVQDLIATAITGGTIKIEGSAVNQEIAVRAAGEFWGENLVGEKIDVRINGGGRVNVFSNNYVNAFVRAGGNIYIYGNPELVDKKTSFGGSIQKIN